MPPAKRRLLRVVTLVLALIGGGLLYAWVCSRFHVGIGCPFYQATGLQCPGCGVSRMCLCLLRLDLPGAWRANPAVLCCLPGLGYLGGAVAVRYVRTGSKGLRKWESLLVYVMIAGLLCFGLARNL